MHISEQVALELNAQGWANDGSRFHKRIEGWAMAGTMSDGARIVTLQICDNGRWFERVDMGLGSIEREIDLRDYADNAKGAIVAALS